MSLPVLIAKTECKSFANSLHLYELLFFFSLASVKKRPHTLHLRFTFAAWISIQYCSYNSLKKSRLDHGFKKIVAISLCCICVLLCVLMSVITFLPFSIGRYTRLKLPSLFPPKTHGREKALRIITDNNAVLARRRFCLQICYSICLCYLFFTKCCKESMICGLKNIYSIMR